MINYRQMSNLFLQQSYKDSWDEYKRWLDRGKGWDFVVLTASNEAQARGYRQEIAYRRAQGYLAGDCEYIVLPDPEGKRVGSGGATLNVLRCLACEYGNRTAAAFRGKRVLVIHSGGDSKRVPQYSVCGKLFSPVPRQLPDGRPSTLFDEFMIAMSAVAGRVEEGMLVLSGDVLLLFNPLQLDFQYRGAAAISIKTDVSIGKDHGVFLNNGKGLVGRFLHKQSEAQLRALGAVNGKGNVDLDTGAVLLDVDLMTALYSLIATEQVYDEQKFADFVNDRARISFYGDFLYPLATEATLEDYYREAPEGTMCRELLECREKIWQVLSKFSMKLICLSPAEFIHFGTTGELLDLVTKEIGDYRFLGWSGLVNTNVDSRQAFPGYAVYNSVIEKGAVIGADAYIENSYVAEGVTVGNGSILSAMEIRGDRWLEAAENPAGFRHFGQVTIPAGVVLHGLSMPDRKYVVRIYDVQDNPKALLEKNAAWLGAQVSDVLEYYDISEEQIWREQEHYLWFADLYPVCDSAESALQAALTVYRIFRMEASRSEVVNWLAMPRMSLYSSFNQARAEQALEWNKYLTEVIATEKFVEILRRKGGYRQAAEIFACREMAESQFTQLMDLAEKAEFSLRIRLYFALARYLRETKRQMGGVSARDLEERCFDTIQQTICDAAMSRIKDGREYRICREECNVALPVRVNWGGGWTDTPPYCNENGGIVLNAAIRLNGILPVQVTVRRLPEYHVEFASEDIGVQTVIESIEEIRDCKNPFDHFALHKAALLACGLIPMSGDAETLRDLLARLGGGIYLSTKVVGIPKGSGLGTSSILAGACVKAIFDFLGQEIQENDLYDIVLCMEQIMSTGGGWQDQVGGLCPGIKLITTEAGLEQHIQVENVKVPLEAMQELQERFALIYTGQRRLARNLLRDVVGNYIGGRPESLQALEEMQRVAVLMKYELEKGNIDRFAALLNEHWKLSLQLDSGASNTCIDQIFRSCEDLIDGRFIAGAGGGGFLQVILKKGVTSEQLNDRLYEVFQDSGVVVWKCEFV